MSFKKKKSTKHFSFFSNFVQLKYKMNYSLTKTELKIRIEWAYFEISI